MDVPAALGSHARPSADQPGAGQRVGVLAVQGAFDAHRRVLGRLGAEVVEVRRPEDVDHLDALVLPGGESTTISKMLEFNGLFEPLGAALRGGLRALGTCAGMIVLAGAILDGRADQRCLGALDIDVRRNAFGRQRDSFETDLDIAGIGPEPFPAVFIRAPVVARVGPGVEVLARLPDDHGAGAGEPVLCRAGHVLVAAFHPELSEDDRLHRLLLAEI
ncbi:MAG: pyridoxal 5'-phosphate synthase glutaminase subunit PdxT [Acidimicrobiia bacterium]|nr:pyridoxal 5'-phosphate synthase glutaminase subunit PdxT [Acidimicrobiia bacterium]